MKFGVLYEQCLPDADNVFKKNIDNLSPLFAHKVSQGQNMYIGRTFIKYIGDHGNYQRAEKKSHYYIFFAFQLMKRNTA